MSPMTRPGVDKIAFTAFLLLVGLLFLRLTLPLGRIAQMVPIRVLVPTIALLVLQLVIDWRARRNMLLSDRQEPETRGLVAAQHRVNGSPDRRLKIWNHREYHILVLLVLLPVLIYLVGFIVSAILIIWFYYRFYLKKSILISAALSLSATIFFYFLMIMLMGMDIKYGMVWNVVLSAY
jgi:VIT1/CCC1 family predicted Fe2+/Mn2+ transporter